MAGLLHPQYQSVTHPRKGGGVVEEGVGCLVVSGMEVSSAKGSAGGWRYSHQHGLAVLGDGYTGW